MTTKSFSATSLPYPDYYIELGRFNIGGENPKIPKWMSRLSNTVHLVEVKETGSSFHPDHVPFDANNLLDSYIMIENARPELFIRRDFIKKFVDQAGQQVIIRPVDPRQAEYMIETRDNVMHIVLNEKQYRRFGLIAKRVIKDKQKSASKSYVIEIDLKNKKLLESNKFQDKLMMTLKRLASINKLYFRVLSSESGRSCVDECLEFFRYVIDEYAIDGLQPVPLTACSKLSHKIEKKWTNFSQVHPDLSLASLVKSDKSSSPLSSSASSYECCSKLVDTVDWIGYQLLSINCDRDQAMASGSDCLRRNMENGEAGDDPCRLDVTCTQLRGPVEVDYDLLRKFFVNDNKAHDLMMVKRALIIHDPTVVLIQDCCSGGCASELITVGMSG